MTYLNINSVGTNYTFLEQKIDYKIRTGQLPVALAILRSISLPGLFALATTCKYLKERMVAANWIFTIERIQEFTDELPVDQEIIKELKQVLKSSLKQRKNPSFISAKIVTLNYRSAFVEILLRLDEKVLAEMKNKKVSAPRPAYFNCIDKLVALYKEIKTLRDPSDIYKLHDNLIKFDDIPKVIRSIKDKNKDDLIKEGFLYKRAQIFLGLSRIDEALEFAKNLSSIFDYRNAIFEDFLLTKGLNKRILELATVMYGEGGGEKGLFLASFYLLEQKKYELSLELQKAIPNGKYSGRAFFYIITRALREKGIEKALALLEEQPEGWAKNRGQLVLLGAYLNANKPYLALELAYSMPEGKYKIIAYYEMVKYFVKNEVEGRAFDLANAMQSGKIKGDAYCAIAQYLLRKGRTEEALELVLKQLDGEAKQEVIFHVVKAILQDNQLDRAFGLVDNMSQGYAKGAAYCLIADYILQQGDTEKALELTLRQPEGHDRSSVLIDIIRKKLELNEFDEAYRLTRFIPTIGGCMWVNKGLALSMIIKKEEEAKAALKVANEPPKRKRKKRESEKQDSL